MAGSSTKRFPLYAKDYELFEEVGEGVSATVYKARCIALNEIVAVKILDLEKCRNDLVRILKSLNCCHYHNKNTIHLYEALHLLVVHAGNYTQGSSYYEFNRSSEFIESALFVYRS